MKAFPVFAQALLPNIKRCRGKRDEHKKAQDTDNNIGLLKNGLDDETPRQAVIEIDEDQYMNGRIHERIQTESAAAFDQLTPSKESIERCAR
jgi:hypothetical protein